MAAGDLASAEAALLEAVSLDKSSLSAWLNLAAVRRQRQDLDGAFNAIREVLTLDARNFPALLMSATMLEKEGRAVPAALAYGVALANAPPDERLDAPTLKAVAARPRRPRGLYAPAQRAHPGARRRRRRPMHAGRAPPHRRVHRYDAAHPQALSAGALEYYYPGLPAIEFYERSEFPWLEELEAATAAIGQELVDIIRDDQPGFAPYIHYEQHMPLDQWRELNHSPRWSAYHFYEKGRPIEDRCRRAPATIAAVSRLPQAEVALRSPSAMYSALAPKTQIPPHTGVANFRLVVHLPLVVPPGCGFRVGGELWEWRVGEGCVFDDTIEHEAWNNSDDPRYILICDVWSPRLSPEERAAIAGIIAATDAFNGTIPSAHV